jgi:paraquat-inducible protein A
MSAAHSALSQGLWLCLSCEQLHRVPEGEQGINCVRCGAVIHARKTSSLTRSAAFLAAAAVLYIPANVLPVITSGSLFGTQSDTILSGVIHLWQTGSGLLAAILFIASILVPGVKVATLAFLILAVYRRWSWNPRHRALLYRATAWISRWSMVDIYVGAVLVALVQFPVFVKVEPAPGAVAFAAVVVLTMLASMCFDPRLTWDSTETGHG